MILAALVGCASWAVNSFAQVSRPTGFFEPAAPAPANLNPYAIYPQGKLFGIGLYSVQGNSKIDPSMTNMHRVAAAGFTLAGPYYDTNWRDFTNINLAAHEGLKFTYALRRPSSLVGVTVEERAKRLDAMTDAEMAAGIREQVTAMLRDPVANKTIARWSLGTEELRYWYPSEMRYLKVARATVRAVEQELNAAPRPFWMYEPNNRTTDNLKTTGIYQDVVSRGNYLTDFPRGLNRSGQAMWAFSQTVSAADSLKTLPQSVFQLDSDFQDSLTGKNPIEIRRVIRHDVYLGLTMGIKGINVYSMFENRPNLTTHNDQFQAYASVARDLTGSLNLQNVFLFGERRDDVGISITSGAKKFDFIDAYGKTSTFDTLHTYNAAVGSSRYLILVNSTERPMDVKITNLPARFLLDDLFAGTTVEMLKSEFAHRLDVLGVSAFRIREWSKTTGADGVLGIPVPEPVSVALTTIAVIPLIAVRRRH